MTSDELAVVDTSQIQEKFKDLDMKQAEIRKALKSGIRTALGIVRKSVRSGAASVTSNREKRTKGVSLVVYRNGSGGQVNIYKPFYLSDGSVFKLQWLEEGTKEGTGRNGRRHGATPAKPFFKSAVASSVGQAEAKLSDMILGAIDKIASRRK